ncbi:MAG TPA: polyphosphate kinase 2 [Hyphomicrobiaceae bacterium]|nr:polyphosphate kinase 2 [Hyphomicrobiaceae bacterium]
MGKSDKAKGDKSKASAAGEKATPKQSRPLASFDLDDPKLPAAIEDAALTSGGYPYEKRLKREAFEEELEALQIELVKLQVHALRTRERLLVLYEGRDAAGKGTCISRFREHLNPRYARVVALAKPSDVERQQLYFQRYAAQLPTGGEFVLFDRSWYNRAGVERVMGFCTKDELAVFLREAPEFEGLLVRGGIRVVKFYLEIGREMQWKRFHERRHNPLKRWKISDIDIAAIERFDDYTRAKEEMLRFTHTAVAPWTVVLANDQRRARLETIRVVLSGAEYEGKNEKAIGRIDDRIVQSGADHLAGASQG